MNIRAPEPVRRNRAPCAADPVCGSFCQPGRGGSLSVARIVTAICIPFLLVWTDAFGQVATSLAPFGYQNQVYVPAPNPIPGLTNSPQPKSVAIFGGSIGAAGAASTPTDGSYYLTQSGFGQPAAEARRPDFLIGQEVVPDAALQADLTKAPVIDPPVKAFYLADVQKVFANEAGSVAITWKRADSSSAGPVNYLIDRLPVRTPMAVYHTHYPTPDPGSDFKASPLPSPQTKAPLVNVSAVQQILFHWNTALPLDTNTPYFVRSPNGYLYAKDKTGLILLEYRENGGFRGVEIVALRSNFTPDGPATALDLGSQLVPFISAATSAPPVVTAGLGTGTPETQFIYQYVNPSSTQNGSLFAIRKTSNPADMEVYWMARNLNGVVWPYELHQYTADWPAKPANYQVYVRGGVVLGPDVQMPAGKTATLMPYQDPNGHANPVVNGSFTTTAAGWSLLRYDVANTVAFQVVRSVLHDDPTLFPPGIIYTSNIGQEILEPTHQGPRPGYIYVPGGDRYDWEVYDGNPADPPAFKTQQIFPVNEGNLEIWWSQVNQGVQWPALVKHYQAVWPPNPVKIIIASLQGVGPIDRVNQKDYRLYVQNNPALPGFNPNDEHALIADGGQGPAVFALRDDLGSPSTSQPYCLLKSRDPTAGLKWNYAIYQVVAEEAPYFFNYSGVAGMLIQPPVPLNLFQLCPSSAGVSGPYWRDRKLNFWARAAGNDGGPAQIVLRYFYPMQAGFYFPGTNPPAPGVCVAWLDQRPGGTLGVPTDIRYTINWPSNVPQLRVGETLIVPKAGGLPDIAHQCSVDVLYEQTGPGTLVELYDPLAVRVVKVNNFPGNKLPSEIVTQVNPTDQKLVFMQAPLTLRKRLKFNPNTVPPQFEFGGYYNDTDYVGEPLLLPNVMTVADANALKALSANATYRAAIDALRAFTVLNATGVSSLGSQFKALSAATAQGQGYVTLAMQNSTNCGDLPISVEILKVACPLYQGDIKPIYADCAFDETLTLRHSADFAGNGDNYKYEWFYRRVGDTTWINDPTQTNQELTIKGPGLRTLEDYQYYCHYQPLSGGNLCGPGWSPDTIPAAADGWIKRVLRGINPFTQITTGFHIDAVNTTASMIQQAGPRWAGDIALNCLPGNQFGLIQAYETVLRRGIDLSIGAGIPLSDDTALRLAAGQLSDLYMLMGNEAYADAEDPTIGFGTDNGQYTASSIFCFQGEASSLLDEELILLRGRDGPFGSDNSPGTRVDVAPVYNRLYWNFGADPSGQTAYVLNYNISDQDASGTINATDARLMFPQGHGDAWGHYLSAITPFYQLFSNTNYTWVPQYEDVNINGADVQVNYQYERKFAKVAAARARTGGEILDLTYRSLYTEDPAGQWQGYRDSDTNRAWGATEWASRAGQAALFDWLVGNALLPAKDTNQGPQEVDRTTVSELREVAASFLDIQQTMDNVDHGLNPLGLDKNVVPFGIDPGALATGQTHFDQIYNRAVGAMNNAIAVFNYANEPTQLLRKQQDSVADFQRTVADRLNDFTNQLIEIFGYPYHEDIGGIGAYSDGYTGPDLCHFAYVDVQQLEGVVPPTTQTISLNLYEPAVAVDGTISSSSRFVTFNFATDSRELVKPPGFTTRLAPGELQRNLGDLLQARVRFEQAVVTYNNLISQIEDQAQLIQAQYNLDAREISVLNQAAQKQQSLNDLILADQAIQLFFRGAARVATLVADATAEFLPTDAGFSVDPTSAERGAIRLGGAIDSENLNEAADVVSLVQLGAQQAKEDAQAASNIQLTTIHQEAALLGQVAQLQQLVRQEAVSRYDLYNLREAVSQAAGAYLATLAKGNAVIENRVRFLQETAAQIQAYRYKDMAFRIFRNDALQKYRSQFDLAARYVFLAAKAYDYETGLLQSSSQSGSAFLEDIVKKRAIGTIQNGVPIAGTIGDSGLAAPMAAMGQNYATIKANLGLNNQITRQRLFSLRNGWFRIGNASTNTTVWQQTLQRALVNNIWDIPEFQRYCRPLQAEPANAHEPAIVINFPSEIIAQDNFFGWPAGGGDSAYNASVYSTKILSVGIWFSSYDSSANGLVQYPSAWLVPIGEDVVRAAGANDFSYRHWKVFDQKIPVPNDFLGSPPNFSINWIPINFSLNGQFGAVGGQREYSAIDATSESQSIPLDTAHIQTDSGLIGRSVWNTHWMLIIPGVSLLGSNPDEGLQRFIAGARVNGQRTGNGVTDIKIYFQTYSYSGF